MFSALDISTSGLIAQRTRVETVAANIANANTVLNANGENIPFRRRIALLAPGDPDIADGQGVRVASIIEDQRPFEMRYEPGSPLDTDGDGYVAYPDIDPITEQINAMEAARAYEANIVMADATKRMIQSSLELLR